MSQAQTLADVPSGPAPHAQPLALRVEVARESVERKLADLFACIAHHEAWLARVQGMAEEMVGEDRVTQDRIVAAVGERLGALRTRQERLAHDRDTLRQIGPLAVAAPHAISGNLSRLLDVHACPEEVTARADGSGALPEVKAPDLARLDRIVRRGERRDRLRRRLNRVPIRLVLLGGLCVFLMSNVLPHGQSVQSGPRFVTVGEGPRMLPTVSLPSLGREFSLPGFAADSPTQQTFDASLQTIMGTLESARP